MDFHNKVGNPGSSQMFSYAGPGPDEVLLQEVCLLEDLKNLM